MLNLGLLLGLPLRRCDGAMWMWYEVPMTDHKQYHCLLASVKNAGAHLTRLEVDVGRGLRFFGAL